MFRHAQLSRQDVSELAKGKENRETAQYDVTKITTHIIAEYSMKNAYAFVTKVRSIIEG